MPWKPLEEYMGLLRFLTVLPVRRGGFDAASKGLYLAPLVGLTVACISTLFYYIIDYVDGVLAGLTLFASMYILSGLLHIDGFIDFADTLSSGLTGEDAVRVLKDPHKGGKGIAYTIMLMITVYMTYWKLASLDLASTCIAIVASYESLYMISLFGNPPPYPGLGRLFMNNSRSGKQRNIVIYTAIMAILVLFGGANALIASMVSTMTALAVSRYTVRRAHSILGWVNGDVMGFNLELSRAAIGYSTVLVLLSLAALGAL